MQRIGNYEMYTALNVLSISHVFPIIGKEGIGRLQVLVGIGVYCEAISDRQNSTVVHLDSQKFRKYA